jgi:hypothetical protein
MTQQATDDQLKAAYKDYVRVWHPDRFGHDDRLRTRAEEETKRINAAYDHLRNHVEIETAWREEPTKWQEATWRPDAGAWQEPTQPYEPDVYQREDDYAPQSEPDQHAAWRWSKIFLRSVWRVFKFAVMLAVGALLLLSIFMKLLEYFGDRDRHAKGDLNAGLKTLVTELYVADLLGVSIFAVRGLMFLSALILVGLGLLGSMVWSYMAPHPLLIISSAVVAALGCIGWAMMAEYHFEFVVPRSKDAPRTAAWVMGLVVSLGSVVGIVYALFPAYGDGSALVTVDSGHTPPGEASGRTTPLDTPLTQHPRDAVSNDEEASSRHRSSPQPPPQRFPPAVALQYARTATAPQAIYKYACQIPSSAPEYEEARSIIAANTASLNKLPEGFLETIEVKCAEVSSGKALPEELESIEPTADGKGFKVIRRSHSTSPQ